MGQTLSHGVYLPNEGERNCYAGLASNWQILNTAVGAIAEKAPLVHTHTVSQITDFPAYGTTAGTICEGNDSRLSDARTPVAHTHTKSDVTDLLKSNFIPSANNSYDLGSSSYQWNNLYAKNYYYNGTAWGLDKANEWTGLNTFSSTSNCIFSFKFGSSGSYNDIRYYDSNNSIYACLRSKVTDLTLGVKYSSKSAWYDGASVVISNNGNVQIKSYDGTENWTVNFTPVGVYPTSDKSLELGTSTNKWKTLNGINPGALSLPDISKYDNVTSQVQPPAGESALNIQGGANTWTASADGYLVYMGRYNHFSQVYLYIAGTYIGAQMSTDANSTPLYRFVSVPVCKNQVVQIQVYGTQFNSVYFYPNLGNV